MSQTKEEIEVELQSFKDANVDWRIVEWKANTVTGFNNRLASLTGNNFSVRFYDNHILLITFYINRGSGCKRHRVA